jgi:hypothetical protein
MAERNSCFDKFVLAGGYLAVTTGLVYSLYSADGSWFQRCGVFGIVASVVAEYVSVLPQITALAAFKSKVKETGKRSLLDTAKNLNRLRVIQTCTCGLTLCSPSAQL